MQPPFPRTDAPGGARLVVLVSGAGTNLAALLSAQEDAAWGARVVGVVADRAAAGLDLARAAGVPTAVVAAGDFPDRGAWDEGLAEAVRVFRPDLVVTAGFMRIIGEPLLGRFPGRIVNTHPALLPAFPGAHAVRDALAAGVAVTGCSVHLVDAGMDTGPVIARAEVAVRPGDDEASLHERIKVAERRLLTHWVGRIAREGIAVEADRVLVGGREIVDGPARP